MVERINLSSPDVGSVEQEYVQRALESVWVAPLGPEVDAFEAEVAERVGRKYAVALSSGTAALHLGLLALGVGPGDVVVTATMTFAATANAVMYVAADKASYFGPLSKSDERKESDDGTHPFFTSRYNRR